MRGIHRHAYYYDLPIKGTDLTARDIAEPLDTCNWCNHMLGVSPEFKGSQEYYNSLFELYASWEIDFVKVDDIMYPEYHKGEIEMIRKAIDKCGRPMVLSLSPGEAPVKMAEHLMKNANMWRISADFWDDWEKLEHSFDLLNTWSAYVSPGSWPDADMLPIGRISLDDRPHGPERWSKFTLAEQYTLLSLWIISRSPLMLGSDLVSLPDTILSLITNPEVIAVNQNSTGNKQVYNKDGTAAWTGLDPESGDKYLALFNLTDSARTVDFDFLSDSLSGKYLIRDLWKHQNKGIFYIKFGELLEPHGAGLYKLSRQ